MKTTRRKFIKEATFITGLLATGGIRLLSVDDLNQTRKKVKLRFMMASDAHLGQPKTDSTQMAQTFIDHANLFHRDNSCDFCVLNGDLIHDDGNLIKSAKTQFDALQMPFYVTKGNHDRVTDETWQATWDMPVNLHFKIGKNAFILATTSNEKGTYLPPDLGWMKSALDANRKSKNIFIFIHIPQMLWTPNAIDTPAFGALLSNYPNIKAVFHGHEHDEDGVRLHEKIHYVFDGHIGGSWGTDYRGFRVVEVLKGNEIITYMMNPKDPLEQINL